MDCCQNKEKINKILIFCLLGIVGAIIAIYFFNVPMSSLFTVGLLLLCPLMHIFMMKGHSMGNHQADNKDIKNKEKISP